MAKAERLSKEQRIQHVIETARSLFIAQGYSLTSTSQIARTSGIVEMTLFRYFPTKKDLFEAVISPLTSFDWFPKKPDLDASSPKSLMLSLLHDRVEFAKRERDLVRLVIIESNYHPDLDGKSNPLAKSSKQLRDMLMGLGISDQKAPLIVNLMIGLILTIAFAPNYDEKVINQTLKLIEAQMIQLLESGM